MIKIFKIVTCHKEYYSYLNRIDKKKFDYYNFFFEKFIKNILLILISSMKCIVR